MIRKLAPEALYQAGENAYDNSERPEGQFKLKKSFAEQWTELGQGELSMIQYEHGFAMAQELDFLRRIQSDRLLKKMASEGLIS